jgi:hypothetical protein
MKARNGMKKIKKNKNTNSIPCIDCLTLPICIQRTKPAPTKPGEIAIPPFISPLIKVCSLFHKWLLDFPLYTWKKTAIDMAIKFFEDQYGKRK